VSARARRPTSKSPPAPTRRAPESRESEDDLPTEIYQPAQSTRDAAPRAGSQPIQAISMKTPGADKLAVDFMRAEPEPVLRRPKLRAMAEVTPPSGVPRLNHGFIAPPRDPVEVRSRRMRELIVLASVSVIIASAVALVIWFLAR
jgi:hypothetical protein